MTMWFRRGDIPARWAGPSSWCRLASLRAARTRGSTGRISLWPGVPRRSRPDPGWARDRGGPV